MTKCRGTKRFGSVDTDWNGSDGITADEAGEGKIGVLNGDSLWSVGSVGSEGPGEEDLMSGGRGGAIVRCNVGL